MSVVWVSYVLLYALVVVCVKRRVIQLKGYIRLEPSYIRGGGEFRSCLSSELLEITWQTTNVLVVRERRVV